MPKPDKSDKPKIDGIPPETIKDAERYRIRSDAQLPSKVEMQSLYPNIEISDSNYEDYKEKFLGAKREGYIGSIRGHIGFGKPEKIEEDTTIMKRDFVEFIYKSSTIPVPRNSLEHYDPKEKDLPVIMPDESPSEVIALGHSETEEEMIETTSVEEDEYGVEWE